MKMFTVEKDTPAFAFNLFTGDHRKHTVRHQNIFTDTMTDPIAYQNGRYVDPGNVATSKLITDWFNDLAENGYYIFHDEHNRYSGWLLIVSWKYVKNN